MKDYRKARRSYVLPVVSTVVSFFTFAAIQAQTPAMHVLTVRSPAELKDYFKYTGKDIPLISGHRGGITKGYPENCIASFENTLRHTAAFFEIDPRLTKDSVLVLMHDATLDRTTNGTGKLSDFTWEEVKKLKLKDVEGNVTDYHIPTLDEVIKWSKGKTIINLDKKDVPLTMTAAKIREHNAEEHVMVTVHNAEQAKFYHTNNPQLMFSAFILTKEALAEYEHAGIPMSQMIAYIGPKNKPENKELINLLHAKGIMCMISAAPSYDKLGEKNERAAAYQEIIKSGADIIESDRPIEVGEAIKSLIPSTSKKKKYFDDKP